MKLKFDFVATYFDGEPFKTQEGEDLHVGKFLAKMLGTVPSKEINDASKSTAWGHALFNNKEIDLDKSDQKKFMAFIKEEIKPSPIVEDAIMDVFDKAEKKDSKKPEQKTES